MLKTVGPPTAEAGPGILGTLAAGGRVVLLDDPAPDTAFQAIERERVTVTSLTPGLAGTRVRRRLSRPAPAAGTAAPPG